MLDGFKLIFIYFHLILRIIPIKYRPFIISIIQHNFQVWNIFILILQFPLNFIYQNAFIHSEIALNYNFLLPTPNSNCKVLRFIPLANRLYNLSFLFILPIYLYCLPTYYYFPFIP